MKEFRCPIIGDTAVTLAGDNSIEFLGYGDENDIASKTRRRLKFTPHSTKGYCEFSVSSAFPSGITSYRTALWSKVIENSFSTLLHGNLNREHSKKIYDPKKEDKNIGSIVAINFPDAPMIGGGWRIGGETPKITGVACYDKLSTAIQQFVGEHMAGRSQHTVSMEVLWRLEDAGFAVNSGGKGLFKDTTPDHFAQAGWDYVPYKDAPKDLKATFRDGAVKGKWKNNPVAILMGGLDGAVHYAGLGVVRYGAEPTAKINRLTASGASPFARLLRAAELTRR
jgi:hypothetical protein